MEEKILSIEEKLLRQAEKKRRKKRKRKLIRLVFLFSALCLLILYLFSDMSKVKSLTVLNNIYYSDEQILEKAQLDYHSSYWLTIRFWVNHLLEQDPLIKDASLSKDLQGGFTITVEEEKIIGYLNSDPSQILIQGTGMQTINDIELQNVPRLGEFTDEQLQMLDDGFEDVDTEILSMVSEILPHSESYNANMVRIVMNDGNRITTSYKGIYLLNSYKKILPQLEGTHVCLFMDEYSGNIIKQNTDCINTSSEKNPQNSE